MAAVGDGAAHGRRPQLPVPHLRQPAHTPWCGCACWGRKSVGEPEISTALLIPKFTIVEDGAFLADDHGRVHANWAAVDPRRQGDDRQAGIPRQLGQSPSRGGESCDDGLVAVLSATPHKAAKAGSSWLGSPPARLRRKPTAADVLRTFHPSLRLKILRALVETLPADPGDGDVRDRCGCAVRVAVAGGRNRLGVDCTGQRRGAAGRRRARRRYRRDCEMAYGRASRPSSNLPGSSFVWRNEVSTPSSKRWRRRGSPVPPAALP